MKQFALCDDFDALTGIRLAGVEGQMFNTDEKFKEVLWEKVQDPHYGILHISPQLIQNHQALIDEIRLKHPHTLIVELLGPAEWQASSNTIAETIERAIGIKL